MNTEADSSHYEHEQIQHLTDISFLLKQLWALKTIPIKYNHLWMTQNIIYISRYKPLYIDRNSFLKALKEPNTMVRALICIDLPYSAVSSCDFISTIDVAQQYLFTACDDGF